MNVCTAAWSVVVKNIPARYLIGFPGDVGSSRAQTMRPRQSTGDSDDGSSIFTVLAGLSDEHDRTCAPVNDKSTSSAASPSICTPSALLNA